MIYITPDLESIPAKRVICDTPNLKSILLKHVIYVTPMAPKRLPRKEKNCTNYMMYT